MKDVVWSTKMTNEAIRILKIMVENRFFLHGNPSGNMLLTFLPDRARGGRQRVTPIAPPEPQYCQELLDLGFIENASGSDVNTGDRRFRLSDAGIAALTN